MVSSKLIGLGILILTDIYIKRDSKKESADKNLYVKVDQDNLTIIEVYVDDVGNNTKKGGELVFSNNIFFISIIRFIYATSVKGTGVCTQLFLRQPTYI